MAGSSRDERRKSKQEAYRLAQKAKAHAASLLAFQGPPDAQRESEAVASPVPAQILLYTPAASHTTGELLGEFWRWVGGRWQWAPLFAGACTMIKLGEYGVGWFLIALAALAVSSKLSHWKGSEETLARTERIRILGYCLVGMALVFLTIVTFSVKGEAAWSHLLNRSPVTAFRITPELLFSTSDSPHRTPFVVRFKDTLFFTNTALCLSITNLQSVPSQIESVRIEIESTPGQWTRLFRVDTFGQDVAVYIAGRDLRVAQRIAYEDLVFNLLNRIMNSRDAIEGWILLEYPDGIQSIPNAPRFRIQISDKAGVTAIQIVSIVKRPDSDFVDNYKAILFLGVQDVSGFQIGRYRN